MMERKILKDLRKKRRRKSRKLKRKSHKKHVQRHTRKMHLKIKKENKKKALNTKQELLRNVNKTIHATRKNRKQMYRDWKNTFSFNGVPILLV